MKVTEAIVKSEKIIKIAEGMEDWFLSQQSDNQIKMPNDYRLRSAIRKVIDEIYDEGYELQRKAYKVIEGLEIE
jgi:hypothetical protein